MDFFFRQDSDRTRWTVHLEAWSNAHWGSVLHQSRSTCHGRGLPAQSRWGVGYVSPTTSARELAVFFVHTPEPLPLDWTDVI